MPSLMLPRVCLAWVVADALEAWHHGGVQPNTPHCSAPKGPCSDYASDECTPRLERNQPTMLLQRQPSSIP